jgi:hypothetical protein
MASAELDPSDVSAAGLANREGLVEAFPIDLVTEYE